MSDHVPVQLCPHTKRKEREASQHRLMENSDFHKHVPGAFEKASQLAQIERKSHVVTISAWLSPLPGIQGFTGLSSMVGTLDARAKWFLMQLFNPASGTGSDHRH